MTYITLKNGTKLPTILFYTTGKGKGVDHKYDCFSNFAKIPNGLFVNDIDNINKWPTTEHYFQSLKFSNIDDSNYKEVRKLMSSPYLTPYQIFKIGTLLGKRKKTGFYKINFGQSKVSHEANKIKDILNDKYQGKVFVRDDWEFYKIFAMVKAVIYKASYIKDGIFKLPIGLKYPENKNIINKCIYPEFVIKLLNIPDNVLLVEHTKNDSTWADNGDGGTNTLGKNYLGKILTALSFYLKHGSCENMNNELKEHINISNYL